MIRNGQTVTFKVDAYPKDTFSGKVSQIRMNATTVQNVVTYNTIIDFDNPEMKLFPGMTAYITIPVANATNVVRVSNGALRFKPDMPADQIRALYQKYGLNSDQGHTAQASEGKSNPPRTEGQQGGGSEGRGARMDVATVWKLRPDKTLEPVRIRSGITDHTVTEVSQVLKGQLGEGDELVTGEAAKPGATRAPGMGGAPPRR
jgi:HlyD family secretion protein